MTEKLLEYEAIVGRPWWARGPIAWVARKLDLDRGWSARGATVDELGEDLERLASELGVKFAQVDGGFEFGDTMFSVGGTPLLIPNEEPSPYIGPVLCSDCTHWTRGPMDCDVVPLGMKRRSTAVVHKHWTAEDEGCVDFEAKLTFLGRLARRLRS